MRILIRDEGYERKEFNATDALATAEVYVNISEKTLSIRGQRLSRILNRQAAGIIQNVTGLKKSKKS